VGNETWSTNPQSLIERGRIALEALHSRETAAQLRAAYHELQLAIQQAEAGDTQSLDLWLERNRQLLANSSLVPFSRGGPHFFIGGSSNNTQASDSNLSPPSKASLLPSTLDENSSPQNLSPWPKMLEGARRRALMRNSQGDDDSVSFAEIAHHDPRAVSTEQNQEPSPLTLESLTMASDTPVQSPDHEELATLAYNASRRSLVDSITIPESLQTVFLQKAPNTSPKHFQRWLLSPSLLVSIIIHLLGLVAMSVYMIRAVAKPEPKSIVASNTDNQEVSMEAPMELSSPNSEPLDTSAPETPALPSFPTQATEMTSSTIQLPTSMMGVSLEKSPSTTSEEVAQATNASQSNLPASTAEFFGVKAEGNTFCYLVDSSPSMRKDNAFATAKAHLVRSISTMKPKQRFFISFFGKEIEDLTLEGRKAAPFPVYATSENLQKALLWIERVRIQDNGKAPTDVLKKAIEMDPDGIFLLFDGDTSVDVPAFLRKANRTSDIISGEYPRVPIHTLGFFSEEHQAMMKRIAQENLGTFRFIPNPNRGKK
jgi:von Willebrand factor type A domain